VGDGTGPGPGMTEQFPEDVQQFILAHVNSVEQLEVLLLLRAQPQCDWDAAAVGRALYTPPAAADMRLADLHARGLLARKGEAVPLYRYAPNPAELDGLIGRLADLYRERRVSVITLIYSKPHDQVRAFADAFKLRKDK
jgi:hypothetical protein